MKRPFTVCVLLSVFLSLSACSRLETLTPALLMQAQEKWKAHEPASYSLIVEMSGDRVETGRFEVEVRAGEVVSLRRNGLVIMPGRGQDYSMKGLFHMLEQELGLAGKPSLLGAPAGYSAYPMAHFDAETGRLVRYRRTVGGTSNTIDINVVQFAPGT